MAFVKQTESILLWADVDNIKKNGGKDSIASAFLLSFRVQRKGTKGEGQSVG